MSAAINSYTGRTSLDKKTDAVTEVGKTFIPIGGQNAYETAKNPNSAPLLATIIADGLGISANTYSKDKKDSWEDTQSADLTTFRDKVGEDKFKKANDEFDRSVNEYTRNIVNDPRYQKLSDDGKKSLIQRKSKQIKESIFKLYDFEYKAPKRDTSGVNDILGE